MTHRVPCGRTSVGWGHCGEGRALAGQFRWFVGSVKRIRHCTFAYVRTRSVACGDPLLRLAVAAVTVLRRSIRLTKALTVTCM